MQQVAAYYPLIEKANLYDSFVEAYDLKGRGALDPKINSHFDLKEFDNTDYFSVWESKLSLQTRLPVDFSLGYDRNAGEFLNPENAVPQNGLVYGTFNLSILRGLMFDEQRYQLETAELKGMESEIERARLTREILFEAVMAYLNWSVYYAQQNISDSYAERMLEQHQQIRNLYLNGDKPAVDTIESNIYLKTAESYVLEASQQLIFYRQKASLFLWNENGEPLVIQEIVVPDNPERTIERIRAFSQDVLSNFSQDPLIRKIDNQVAQIEVKNRLDREQLKPRLDLKYNTIANLGKESLEPSFSLNDYKYGISLELPIRNRKSRGEIMLNELKIEQFKLNRLAYEQGLTNKFERLTLNAALQEETLGLAMERLTNSEQLYEAEILKFDLGESSVFMLNQRQRNLLDAQSDLNKAYSNMGGILSELYYLALGQE